MAFYLFRMRPTCDKMEYIQAILQKKSPSVFLCARNGAVHLNGDSINRNLQHFCQHEQVLDGG